MAVFLRKCCKIKQKGRNFATQDKVKLDLTKHCNQATEFNNLRRTLHS